MGFSFRNKFVQNRKSVCFNCRKITNQGVRYDKYMYDLNKYKPTIKHYILNDIENIDNIDNIEDIENIKDIEDISYGTNILYIEYPKNQTDKRKHIETFIQNGSICSRCNKKMVLVGSKFKAPKYKNKKQWEYLRP